MTRAAALGRGARRAVSPNPGVGCVLATARGHVYEGATQPPGGNHAEIEALAAAAAAHDDTSDATVWVTLEPCSHHGRTGPCADALIAAGVARVVVALEDPDPNVAGDGLARLRDAGVAVEVGVGGDEVRNDLIAYVTHRRLGRPFVTLKLATTLDGRTVSDDPTTQWITGPEARADGHRLRAENDAILVGAATVRADNPRLTTRDVPGADPMRIVLGHAPPGAAVHPCHEHGGPIADVLATLAADGVTSLVVEGGADVARQFHEAGLVDRYVLYVASASPEEASAAMTQRWGVEVFDVTPIGHDVRVTLVPKPQA
ncbi:MAG: bifunctional diaminohydroxyphosphoribosylaminopyrimidine deaminase/5-amino-6-(5-phosphoribosylamino)uracil reductase RibD [Acidimicrobiales bacterium]|nr:bifunctional diaminohydroxyphosphoribosylaminopyrimidine deaminase/5-amino-6-(5-phosphoribosylamino)uracil reductase RibD [Acidimicrobiales bacterium]